MTEAPIEIDVINALEPFVAKKLDYLVGDRRKWWASNFFNYMETENASDDERFDALRLLRAEAMMLDDSDLVVLVGNEVTEEALPNYSDRFANLVPDSTGISNRPWRLWYRGWASEEKMHGRVLDRYLLLTGRVNMKAVDHSVDSLIKGGMKEEPDVFRSLIYPAFQEPATALSHQNMALIAKRKGVETLHAICSKIAGDESRHAAFYNEVVAEMMRIEPERTLLAYQSIMKDSVVMPAVNMIDSTYPEPPTLFEHFAGVANKIGVYTTRHYAEIVEKLNKKFGVAKASVKGEAARAQEYLGNLPARLQKMAERTKLRVADPVGFDWIYGRAA